MPAAEPASEPLRDILAAESQQLARHVLEQAQEQPLVQPVSAQPPRQVRPPREAQQEQPDSLLPPQPDEPVLAHFWQGVTQPPALQPV